MELSARNTKVLIVEDHFLSRQMITVALRGKEVTNLQAVSDGRQAIEVIEETMAQKKPFHLIFLDWEMPVMNGIDVLRHFRANADYDHVAFVMVTAVAEKKYVMEALKAGATSYVIKPVSQVMIGKKFDEILTWLKNRPIPHDELG